MNDEEVELDLEQIVLAIEDRLNVMQDEINRINEHLGLGYVDAGCYDNMEDYYKNM